MLVSALQTAEVYACDPQGTWDPQRTFTQGVAGGPGYYTDGWRPTWPTSRRPFFGLIADGVHVHPASLKIAAAARRDRVVLVTDSMAAMGLPPGTYRLGNV